MGLAKDLFIGGDIVGSLPSDIAGFDNISAVSFTGDGANLTNTGSTLSAASGTQRVVLTSLTSGQMTTTATDADITFDASTNTLNVANISSSGNLNGNATTATTATNVVGDANRVLFNNNTNTTTTSGNLTYNGTQLNVAGNVRANGITLGLTAGTTINTATGDLVLDSSNNKVPVSYTHLTLPTKRIV